MKMHFVCTAENEERKVKDMTEEKSELQPVGDMNMATHYGRHGQQVRVKKRAAMRRRR